MAGRNTLASLGASMAPERRARAEQEAGSTAFAILAKHVRVMRTRLGWKQLDLANQAGISQQRISLIEQGTLNVTLGTIEAVADALGVSVADLFKEPRRERGVP